MPVNFIGPGDTISGTGFFYNGNPVDAPTGVYHTQQAAYFNVGNSLRQGSPDITFTQGLVGAWLSDIIEVDGYNIQAQLQTALSDGVLTDSELLLLQYDMDQYALEVQMSTNLLGSMKQAMTSIVNNLR